MNWPSPHEYNEAVQHPALCFRDADLKAATVETTALGLPRPITGNFASVYRLKGPAGDWAVRCFWRAMPDLQMRYAAISAHLERHALSCAVPFVYLPEDIRVGRTWLPVVKMRWQTGQLLSEFVERHLRDPRALRALARHWVEMLTDLEGASMAHGDLQHGNVLVEHGALKLVDYDGMFVPALQGLTNHEIGHPNYQHPGRTGEHTGVGLDRFAGWIVLLSLLALAAEPDLWADFGGGDECLLFRSHDLGDPAGSALWTRVQRAPSAEVRGIADTVRGLLSLSPDRLPPVRAAGASRRPGSGWRSPPVAAPAASMPTWITRPGAPEGFGSVRGARAALGLSVCALGAAATPLHVVPVLDAGSAALAGSAGLAAYLLDPSVRQRRGLLLGRARCAAVISILGVYLWILLLLSSALGWLEARTQRGAERRMARVLAEAVTWTERVHAVEYEIADIVNQGRMQISVQEARRLEVALRTTRRRMRRRLLLGRPGTCVWLLMFRLGFARAVPALRPTLERTRVAVDAEVERQLDRVAGGVTDAVRMGCEPWRRVLESGEARAARQAFDLHVLIDRRARQRECRVREAARRQLLQAQRLDGRVAVQAGRVRGQLLLQNRIRRQLDEDLHVCRQVRLRRYPVFLLWSALTLVIPARLCRRVTRT